MNDGRRLFKCVVDLVSCLVQSSIHPSNHLFMHARADWPCRIEANSMALHGIALWIIDKLIQRRFEESDPKISHRPTKRYLRWLYAKQLSLLLPPLLCSFPSSHPPIKTTIRDWQTDRLRHPLRTQLMPFICCHPMIPGTYWRGIVKNARSSLRSGIN